LGALKPVVLVFGCNMDNCNLAKSYASLFYL